jgi:hypothetical protein
MIMGKSPGCDRGLDVLLAERQGFEPWKELYTPYSLSRRVLSAAQPPLRGENDSITFSELPTTTLSILSVSSVLFLCVLCDPLLFLSGMK